MKLSPEELDRILKRPGYKAREQGGARSDPPYDEHSDYMDQAIARNIVAIRARNGKYNAKPTEAAGVRFPSKKQAERYESLLMLQKAGMVRDLRYEVTYTLAVNGVKICDYRADFVYFDCDLNREVVEDSKGVRTPAYKLKKLLMLAVHGIAIFET